jgi:chorismate mutase
MVQLRVQSGRLGRSMLRPYKAWRSGLVIPSEARNLLFCFRRGLVMNMSDWRRRIDEIDKKLVELLNERSRCALEIGKLKQAANLPLYQPEREQEVLNNAENTNAGPLTDAAIRRLFERIIDEARAAERDAMHGDGESRKDSK